tara:strand:+ start:597 stop:968 length:372 start_codon:yes stop_codon:yes gene_type:complete
MNSKKDKYRDYIVEKTLEQTIFDNGSGCFNVDGIKGWDGDEITFSFTLKYVEKYMARGVDLTYDTYPQIMVTYMSNHWGIDDKVFGKEIFNKFMKDLYGKLPLLKQYIDERYWHDIKLNIKHI